MKSLVKKVWQEQAGTLLVLYVVLDQLPFIIMRIQGDMQDTPVQHAMALLALDACLVWRICRGGSISWAILLVINILDLFSTMFMSNLLGALGPWNLSTYLVVCLLAGEVALLLSPAIRRRIGPARRGGRRPAPQGVRPWPCPLRAHQAGNRGRLALLSVRPS